MSWYSRSYRYSYFAPYVPMARRRQQAEALAKKMAKAGNPLEPVKAGGRRIANTFWGKEWCDNLEAYSDYSNRLPRGRTYVGNGSVIDLKISAGKVKALVQGSSLYKVEISIASLTGPSWLAFKKRCAGRISSLLDLLQGRLDKGVLEEITRRPGGLFPAPKEIKLSCSCPDGAYMCKHVAAVMYGVGAKLDGQPELFFILRGADLQELITAASKHAAAAAGPAPVANGLAASDLSAIFGVEIEAESAAAPATRVPGPRKKPASIQAAAKTKPDVKKRGVRAQRKPKLRG
jgi:uncharacterized Zn finger protein